MLESTFLVQGSLEQIDEVRKQISRIAEEFKLEREKHSDLELVLIELFSNIVKHGAQNEMEPVCFDIILSDREVVAEIKDSGLQYLPNMMQTIMPKVSSDPNLLLEHGYGIPLVVTLMSSIKYDRVNDKNITTVKLSLD